MSEFEPNNLSLAVRRAGRYLYTHPDLLGALVAIALCGGIALMIYMMGGFR